MNNIEILEERINFCKNNTECREELKQCFGCTFEIEEIQAIENLIQENKELNICNEIKQLFENDMLGYIRGYEDGRNGSTGLAYKVGKQFSDYILTLKLSNYKEDYLKVRKLLDESIPKSKIKAKIEETNSEKLNYNEDDYWFEQEAKVYAIDKLQELLEEGK